MKAFQTKKWIYQQKPTRSSGALQILVEYAEQLNG
jgi:hypothetical protein